VAFPRTTRPARLLGAELRRGNNDRTVLPIVQRAACSSVIERSNQRRIHGPRADEFENHIDLVQLSRDDGFDDEELLFVGRAADELIRWPG
tara:strand:- start:723 stop:995 length:273 start_codon:yes stop_codon:yes gene_type:complete